MAFDHVTITDKCNVQKARRQSYSKANTCWDMSSSSFYNFNVVFEQEFFPLTPQKTTRVLDTVISVLHCHQDVCRCFSLLAVICSLTHWRYKNLDATSFTVPIGLFLHNMKMEERCGKQWHNTSKHCCLPLPDVMFERCTTTSGEADSSPLYHSVCVMWVTELMEQRAWLIKPVHPLCISL